MSSEAVRGKSRRLDDLEIKDPTKADNVILLPTDWREYAQVITSDGMAYPAGRPCSYLVDPEEDRVWEDTSGYAPMTTLSSSRTRTLTEAVQELTELMAKVRDLGDVTWVLTSTLRAYEDLEFHAAQVWCDGFILKGKWEIDGATLKKVL